MARWDQAVLGMWVNRPPAARLSTRQSAIEESAGFSSEPVVVGHPTGCFAGSTLHRAVGKCPKTCVAGEKPQLVPAHPLRVIQASTQPAVVNQDVHAMVECMVVGCTRVKVDETGNIPEHIANFGDRDIYICARRRR